MARKRPPKTPPPPPADGTVIPDDEIGQHNAAYVCRRCGQGVRQWVAGKHRGRWVHQTPGQSRDVAVLSCDQTPEVVRRDNWDGRVDVTALVAGSLRATLRRTA